MKRFFTPLVVAIYFFLLTSVSFAQSPTISDTEEKPASPTPTIVERVVYDLPYPGMLPDNPLYFLKGVRDKIIEILISDPVKKGEFYLLSSDKRLNSGYYLIEKGKDEMGVLYISKSNNYMHKAVSELQKTGEKGEGILEKAKTSVKKHKEVMEQAIPNVEKKYRTELSNEIDRLKEIETLLIGKQ